MATMDTTTPTVERLWADLGGPLHAFVHRRVGDADTAQDIVGDVMLRIHQHVHELDDRDKVTAWVYRIARNAITDHYRRRARRPEQLGDLPEHVRPGARADEWIEDQDALTRELAQVLRPLVSRLPADYRRAIELTDLGGATQAEAARQEGISVSGMKSRVQRGRRQLAALLHDHCEITLDATGRPTDCGPRHDGCQCSATAPS